MDHKLNTRWLALRLGIGLTATVAGMDKSFNLLAAAFTLARLAEVRQETPVYRFGAIAHASH
jgi:hypothetical protein